jgi:hypothetical protein
MFAVWHGLPRLFITLTFKTLRCEISSSHGGEYKVQNCLLGCTAVWNNCRPTFQRFVLPPLSRMSDPPIPDDGRQHVTSETSVDNYFTRQYIPEDNSEPKTLRVCLVIDTYHVIIGSLFLNTRIKICHSFFI